MAARASLQRRRKAAAVLRQCMQNALHLRQAACVSAERTVIAAIADRTEGFR